MNGQIFISYRREDGSAWAGRLYDRLQSRFAAEKLFMDVDSLAPGVDFVEALERSVGGCDVLIAVIGRRWLSASDEEGNRRLDNPEDFVRVEVAMALRRGIRVIPVLVDGAPVPCSRELPDELKALVRRNALEVSHNRFSADSERLIRAVEEVLESARVEQQRQREEQERLEAEQREREEKKRLEAERRQGEEQERQQAERREIERRGQERLRVEQRLRAEQERLDAAGRQQETPAPEGKDTGLRARVLAVLEKRPRLLVIIGSGVAILLLSFGLLFKAPPLPAPTTTPSNSPNPTPLVSQAFPSPSLSPSTSSPIASGGTPSASATPSPRVNEQPAEAAVPPPPHAYANDYANLLRPETLTLLNARLADYERQTSNQFLLVIFERLPTSEDVSGFALKAFRAWKPGLAGRNNGAILFVFVLNRKVRIEVGLGLEQTLSNDTCKHIITDIITPAFKAGDYERGVLDGIQAMMAAAKDAYKGDGHTIDEKPWTS